MQEDRAAALPEFLQACGHFRRPKLEPVTRPPVIVRIASATSPPGITVPDSHWKTLGWWTGRPNTAESRSASSCWEIPSAFRHSANVVWPGMLYDVFEVVVGLRGSL